MADALEISYQEYEIDWSKVKTTDDVICVLKYIAPRIELIYPEQCPCLDLLKKVDDAA